jgi:hypothetical protein
LAQEQSSNQELATQLSNPVSTMISVPFQFNWDHEFGPDRTGHKTYLEHPAGDPGEGESEWNFISRVIVPIVDQHIPFIGDGHQSGVVTSPVNSSFRRRNRGRWNHLGVGPAI